MRIVHLVVVLLFTTVYFVGESWGATFSVGKVVHSNEIEFRVLHEGVFINDKRNHSRKNAVLPTLDTYEQILSEYSVDATKQVNFNHETLLLLDLGRYMTGGYTLGVRSVVEHLRHVVVNISIIYPGKACVLTQAITNPFQFVAINSRKSLIFVEELVYQPCN